MEATIPLVIIASLASFGHLTQLITRSVIGSSFVRLYLLEMMVFTLPSYFVAISLRAPILISATVTHAPIVWSTSTAPFPTVPHPHTRALIPGAAPKPLTNLPLPPFMLIIAHRPINAPAFPAASQFGEPYLWESSAVMAITFFSRSASTSSLCAAGWMQQKIICPSLIRSYSLGSISLTLATKSQIAQISSLVAKIVAPAAAYSLSSKPAA